MSLATIRRCSDCRASFLGYDAHGAQRAMVALADWLIEAKLSKTRKLDYAMNADPMSRTKDEYAAIVDHISVANSPVGIDAQLTHAIIITYLQQIAARLDKIESQLSAER